MSIRLNGATSGSIEIDVPAVAGTDTAITIPATSGGEFIVSDSAGDVNIDSGTLFVDASADRVGVGTTSPARLVHLSAADSTAYSTSDFDQTYNFLRIANTTDDRTAGIYFGIGSNGEAAIAATETADGATALTFGTRGGGSRAERMRIASGGDTYIRGNTDTLFVLSNAGAGTTADLIRGLHSATSQITGTLSFRVFSNGNVQNTNNSYGQISDVKLKENIVDASSQWNDLKAVQVRNFNFKEETGNPTHTQIGVIAQELELVSPGLVKESPDRDEEGNDLGTTTKSVSYSVLYMKAVKALQEAMERIETLEAKVAALEGGTTE